MERISLKKSLKHGLPFAGASLILGATLWEAFSQNPTRQDLGISLDCPSGKITVWAQDYQNRRLVLEMDNVTADRRGTIGNEKPENSNVLLVVGENGKVISNQGEIPIAQGDVIKLKALEPTSGSETIGVRSITTSVNCKR